MLYMVMCCVVYLCVYYKKKKKIVISLVQYTTNKPTHYQPVSYLYACKNRDLWWVCSRLSLPRCKLV